MFHWLLPMVKYKIYIIDKVHMLTKEAFNALLKTLEEPPSHTIFILATTGFSAKRQLQFYQGLRDMILED